MRVRSACIPPACALLARGSNWLDMKELAGQKEATAFIADGRPPPTAVASQAPLRLPPRRDVAIAAAGLLLGLALGKAVVGGR